MANMKKEITILALALVAGMPLFEYENKPNYSQKTLDYWHPYVIMATYS